VAESAGHREAGDRDRLAPAGLPALLDVEVPSATVADLARFPAMASRAAVASAKLAPKAGLMLTRRKPISVTGLVAKDLAPFNQRFDRT